MSRRLARGPKWVNPKPAAQYRRRKAKWNRDHMWVEKKGSQAQHTERRDRENPNWRTPWRVAP